MRPKDRIIIQILSLIIVILLAILLAPYFIIHNNSMPDMDMSEMSPDMMKKTFEISAANSNGTTSIPTVDFTLTKDKLDGWDLHILTTNFTFTPEDINAAPIADQGHVHLYIDGTLSVVFGPWYHIDSKLLPPGKHMIMVSLNANDHSTFTNQGKPLQAMQTLNVLPI